MILAWYRFHPCAQCVLKVVLNLDDAGQFRVISVCDRSKGSMQTADASKLQYYHTKVPVSLYNQQTGRGERSKPPQAVTTRARRCITYI